MHLRSGLNQAVTIISMVLLIQLPSWKMVLWFNAVNLPMCILNSMRLQHYAKSTSLNRSGVENMAAQRASSL